MVKMILQDFAGLVSVSDLFRGNGEAAQHDMKESIYAYSLFCVWIWPLTKWIGGSSIIWLNPPETQGVDRFV